MFVKREKIECDNSTEFYLVPIGDIHIGNRYSDINRLQKYIKIIYDMGCYWISMGDMCESIFHTDPRYDESVVDQNLNTLDKQLDYVEWLLEPIKDKCICMCTGNHEEAIRKKYTLDITKELCRRLDVDYGGYNAVIRLTFVRDKHMKSVDLFATHGYFNGRTLGGRVNKVEQLADIIDVDLYLMGHTHDIAVSKNILYKLNNHCKLAPKEKTFVLTGGFLKGYTNDRNFSYIEKKLYRPLKVGCPIIKINPEYGKIEVKI